jgi:hypothetical protein
MRRTKVERAVQVQDRRGTERHAIRTPLRIRVWKSAIPEHVGESENISEQGIFFETHLDLPIGTVVEVFLRMPEEVSGEPTAEWRCTGHVVRVDSAGANREYRGVGIQFDCYQVSKY